MLSLSGEEKAMYDIAETLGFLEEGDALAVSVYERPNYHSVEALYEALDKAKTAQSRVGGEISKLEDKDWVSETQSGLPPVEAGRFFIHGSHDANKIPEHAEFPILIDAGMAFGTGHHGTTKGCLIILDDLLKEGFQPESVLDLGCGAGILAIAAAKALQNNTILASDIDQDAVDVTLENAEFNSVSKNIEAFKADGFVAPELESKTFDLIFANILAGPLMGLARDIFQATSSKGKVILSGILNEQAETVKAAFETSGFEVESKTKLDEWTSLLATKPL